MKEKNCDLMSLLPNESHLAAWAATPAGEKKRLRQIMSDIMDKESESSDIILRLMHVRHFGCYI